MTIAQIVPDVGHVALDDLVARARDSRRVVRAPFSDETLAFVESVSNDLFHDAKARQYGELQSLAFWLRRAQMTRLAREFAAAQTPDALLMPRGLVLHFPPSNVDTIFMYSWVLAMVTGNASIVRISERATGAATVLIRIVNQSLQRASRSVQESLWMVRYGRVAAVTAALSALCDVRVIWGGDASVDTIRQIPLPPHAVELTFPDRSSLAAIRTDEWLAATPDVRQVTARHFYNDTWWFDQMACSSPRLLLWCGGTKAGIEQARASFYGSLRQEIERAGYSLDLANRVGKLTFAGRAILDQPVTRLDTFGSECTVLELPEVSSLAGEHCGGGLLFECHVPELSAIVPFVERRNQTLSHFGFGAAELTAFARLVNGRGLDRLVPMGQALSFNRYWDGYDLLRSFTRVVTIAI